MAIFDNNFLFESMSSVDTDFDHVQADESVEPTMESVVEMNAELAEGVYKLNTSLYITDILAEQSGQTAVLEGAVGDFFDRMKEKFLKIWEKIKGFFKNLGTKIDALVRTNREFVKRYENVIVSLMNNSDAKYPEYKEGEANQTNGEELDGINAISTVGQLGSSAQAAINEFMRDVMNITVVNPNTIKEQEEDYYRHYFDGAKSAEEAKKKIRDAARNKKSGFKRIADKKDIKTYLDFCKKWTKEAKTNTRNAAADADKVMKKILKAIDEWKAGQRRQHKEDQDYMAKVTEACNASSRVIGVFNFFNSKYFTIANKYYKFCVGMLKRFVSKNARLVDKTDLVKKESYSDSILDSIMSAF